MKTIFITGGEGFIGYHLTKELLKDPQNKVVSYDAQKHYIPFDKSDWALYQNYRIQSIGNDRIVRLRGDCNDRGWLKESLEEYKPEYIIHLASLPIASVSNDYPAEAKYNIFDSITTLLDVLRGVSFSFNRILYISSSMVYGNFLRDDKGKIISAYEDQPCKPIGIYGAMKYSGELIVHVYKKRFDIPFVIIRPSSVYGPTDSNKRVSEIFLKNAMNGNPLFLDNGGQHKLDFTYVEDLVRGIVSASFSKDALGETFNITRGEGRKIAELADIIAKLVPNTKIETSDVVPYRPNRGALNISKAKSLLGYSPQFNLEQGMKKYYDFNKKFWDHIDINIYNEIAS
ncbi:MAG: NAD-dependent epimerase/dehydratase family protein [bacterium]